ncbi:MAG: VOC family protein [Dehalococcoidia bacterium]
MREQQIRIFAGGGRELTGETPVGLFTHPRDTHGLWELAEFSGMADPRDLPDRYWSGRAQPEYWYDEHPLGIVPGGFHVSVVVSDLEAAKRVYTRVLDAKIIHERVGDDRELLSAFVFLGRDSVIELIRPKPGDTLAASDLVRGGDIVHSVTFQVRNVTAAESFVSQCGIRTKRVDEESFFMYPEDCHGAVMCFTTKTVPNDPRCAAPSVPSEGGGRSG